MTLSTLALILGLGYAALNLYGLLKPAAFTKSLRAFPRSLPWGFLLMGLATAWFLYNVNSESISDFAAYKKYMLFGFGAIGVGTMIFVRDFLAIRGMSVVLLLLANFTLHFTRVADSPWRLILVTWAYIWVVAGMWFIISPWRCRDYFTWLTANEKRLRISCAVRVAFGLLVAIPGVTALKV